MQRVVSYVVLWPGVELVFPALAVYTLNHWTTREVPKSSLFKIFPHFPLLNHYVLNGDNLENRNKQTKIDH